MRTTVCLWFRRRVEAACDDQMTSPDFNHGHAGFQEAADVLADLSVRLSRLPEVIPHLLVGFVHDPLLVAGHAPRRTATETDNSEHQETMLMHEFRPDKNNPIHSPKQLS